MKIISSYKVQIKQPNHLFNDTVRIYRDAVNFLISVCLNHWGEISVLNGMLLQKSYVESIVHQTKEHQTPLYDFDSRFYLYVFSIKTTVSTVSSLTHQICPDRKKNTVQEHITRKVYSRFRQSLLSKSTLPPSIHPSWSRRGSGDSFPAETCRYS